MIRSGSEKEVGALINAVESEIKENEDKIAALTIRAKALTDANNHLKEKVIELRERQRRAAITLQYKVYTDSLATAFRAPVISQGEDIDDWWVCYPTDGKGV